MLTISNQGYILTTTYILIFSCYLGIQCDRFSENALEEQLGDGTVINDEVDNIQDVNSDDDTINAACEFDIIEEEPDFNATEEDDDDNYQPETDRDTDTGTVSVS